MSVNRIKFVNDLRARAGSGTVSVVLVGYTTDGDGGGGEFYWDASSTEADNSGTIFAVAGVATGRWKRKFDSNDGVSANWWGAVADGVTSATTAIDNSLSYLNSLGGGILNLSAGVYSLASQTALSPDACIYLGGRANIVISGVKGKTILKLAAGDYPTDTFGISTTSTTSKIVLRGLIVDGNKDALGVTNEQIHGVNIMDSDHVDIEDCTFQNWFGDGIRILGSGGSAYVEWIRINKNYFYNCHRSGLTCQRAFRYASITNNQFELIGDTPIDYEPTGVGAPEWNIISGNTILHSSNSNAITLSGIGSSDTNKRTVITNNIIKDGSIQAISLQNIVLANNVIIGVVGGTDAIITFDRECNGIIISNNQLISPSSTKCISMTTGTSRYPKNIQIIGNELITDGIGVYGEAIAGNIIISNNIIQAYTPGGPSASGVFITSTGSNPVCENIHIVNNQFIDVTNAVKLNGASDASAISKVVIKGNIIKNVEGQAGILFQGSSTPGPSGNFSAPILVSDNQITSSVRVSNIAGGPSFYSTKGANDTSPYSNFVAKVAPEAVVTAGLDSLCFYNNQTYKKSTTSGNTGWNLVTLGGGIEGLGFGTANQMVGMNSSADDYEFKTIALSTTAVSGDVGITHTAGVLTLNLPSAGSSTRGLVTTGTQTFTGAKTFNSQAVFANGLVTDAGGVANANMAVGSTGVNSTTTSNYLFGGASTINYRVAIRGTSPNTLSANASAGALVIGNQSMATAATGTHAIVGAAIIKAPTISSGGAGVTNASTLYIEDAPSGVTPSGGNYALWIDNGQSRMDDTLNSSSVIPQTDNTYNVGSSSFKFANIYATTLRGDGSNITGLTKSQVGLGSVANADTTDASNISAGTLNDSRLSTNVTVQGNTFNGASQLVKTNGSTQLPAIDGSLLTKMQIGPLATSYANGFNASASSTTFGTVMGGAQSGSATEGNRQNIISSAGVIKNWYIVTSTSQPGTGSCVFTLRKNGVDTALVITVSASAAAGNFSDTTNSVTVAAGDLLSIKIVNSATTGGTTIMSTSMNLYNS